METIKPKAKLIKTYKDKKTTPGRQWGTVERLTLTYRDENGEKHTRSYYDPDYEYYVLKDKDNEATKHSPIYIERDLVDAIKVPTSKLYSSMAENVRRSGEITNILHTANGNFDTVLKNLNRFPEIYNGDIDIEDYYIAEFYKEFDPAVIPLHKVFFDIEVDLCPGGLSNNKEKITAFPYPETAPAPVVVITLIDDLKRTVDIFTVRDRYGINQSYKKFIADKDNAAERIRKQLLVDSVHKEDIFGSDDPFIKETVKLLNDLTIKYSGENEDAKAYKREYEHIFNTRIYEAIDKGLLTPEFVPSEINIKPYNREKDCIIGFFDRLHEIDPDYCLGWNSHDYDLRTLVNRLKIIVKDEENTIRSIQNEQLKKEGRQGRIPMMDEGEANNIAAGLITDVKYAKVQDCRNGIQIDYDANAWSSYNKMRPIGERFSTFTIVDGINYIDQMEMYAVVHSGEGVKDSYSLNAVGYDLIKTEKLEMEIYGYDIATVYWEDFELGTLYNVRDTLLTLRIDRHTKDTELLDTMSTIMLTRKNKTFSQSTALQNYVSALCKRKGYVMNSNKNRTYGDEGRRSQIDNIINSLIPHLNEPVKSEYFNELMVRDTNGALCSDPKLNNGVGIEVIKNRPSMYLFDTAIDFDFASLYPNITQAFNIDQLSLVGRFVLIDNKIKNNLAEKGFKKISDKDDVGEELVDYIMSEDYTTLASHFLFVKSIDEMIADLSTRVNK